MNKRYYSRLFECNKSGTIKNVEVLTPDIIFALQHYKTKSDFLKYVALRSKGYILKLSKK
jgi:hypothetical protein